MANKPHRWPDPFDYDQPCGRSGERTAIIRYGDLDAFLPRCQLSGLRRFAITAILSWESRTSTLAGAGKEHQSDPHHPL